MNLREYYQSLKYQPSPATSFIMEIASLCHRKEIAVRKWVAGETLPDRNVQEKISAFLNIPVEELFPKSVLNDKSEEDGSDRT